MKKIPFGPEGNLESFLKKDLDKKILPLLREKLLTINKTPEPDYDPHPSCSCGN